jgi:hypothetical protein
MRYVGRGRLIPGDRDGQCFGHPDEIREGLGTHLAHGLTAMHLDGDFAGTQFGRSPSQYPVTLAVVPCFYWFCHALYPQEQANTVEL